MVAMGFGGLSSRTGFTSSRVTVNGFVISGADELVQVPLWSKAQTHFVTQFGKREWKSMLASLSSAVAAARPG